MDCEQALALISARLDREILPSENAWLHDHLRRCPNCQATAEAFALQHRELKQTFKPRRAAVGATADRVNASVAALCGTKGPRRKWRIHRGVLIGAGAAAAWLVAAVMLYTFLNLQSKPAPGPAYYSNTSPGQVPQGGPPPSEWLTARPRPQAPEAPLLRPGQTVTTAASERRRAKLPDGSLVFLNENTSLQIDSPQSLVLSRGGAYFETAQPANDRRAPGAGTLAVMAHDRLIVTPGTKFAVQWEERGSRLTVAEGDVTVGTPAEQPLVTVHAGEMLAPGDRMAAASPRLSHVLDWTRDLMAAAEPSLVPSSSYDGGALVAFDADGQEAKLQLRKYHVDVHIEDGFARTTIDQTYFNQHPWRLEGTFYFPLPPDASLSRLAMYVDDQLNEGGMVERDYGRTVYDRIVAGQRDPALLEWVDGSTFKMRVFPLEGRQEKRLILSYMQRVSTLYGRSQYRFPAGHTLQNVRDWSFHALVKNGADDIALSPTHPGMKRAVQGADLLLDDAAQNCKVDRDVVLDVTDPSFVADDRDAVRFARADLDGNGYLMMRYRPQLPAHPKQEHRDWIFLYEASADRDPLLARAQIEIIRGLLQNAGRDDTFRILAVSDRVDVFPDQAFGMPTPASSPGIPPAFPVTATPDNVAAALTFLDRTHLVGALDLGTAFRAAKTWSDQSGNTCLVHVGAGYTAMGTVQDELLKLVSSSTPYVGIGVGKRWNRSFMKQCAEKTGGYYTQINPDESISWRAFDLMATLNTPRLLNVKVAAANGSRFLVENTAVAQGEELCAVARVQAMPQALTITGTLDGQPFERTVRVEKFTDKAGYIPRTWAKLEIDRLLAEDARKNKNAIVDLSKAMYVMTPFTSLLVLENEAMYKEFKVDRGRKDHWAMYACPEKIPVVYEPDPTMPTDVRNAPKGLKPTANQVLQTIQVRQTPAWLEGTPLRERREHLDEQLGRLNEIIRKQERVFAYTDRAPIRRPPVLSSVISQFQTRGYFLSPGTTITASGFASARPVELDAPPIVFPTPAQIRKKASPADVRFTASYDFGDIGSRLDGAEKTTNEFGLPQSGSPVLFNRANMDAVLENWSTLPEKERAKVRLAISDDTQIEDWYGYQGIKAEGEPIRGWGVEKDALLYQRLHYSGDSRLFTDLLNYAPGLNTSQADILAVLDAEAMPNLRQAPGRIDDDARRLIDQARTGDWQQLTLPGDKDRPGQVILFDGTGRYAYERQPALGLREIVTCDGTTLLHQYPEIGLAARRTVSRFHRAEVAQLLPWLLPPADDLARGADLKCVEPNVVALVPHWIQDAKQAKNETPNYVQVQLVFDGARLAERRLVQMPANKVLAREVYDGKGGIRLLDDRSKEISSVTRKVSAAVAPNLHPDLSGLVVLALPYRSRAHVMDKLDLIPSKALSAEENGCVAYLDTDACETLLANLVAQRDAADAQFLYRRCFQERGDTRRGLFTLLAAAGVDVSREPGYRQCLEATPDDELLQYLGLCTNELYKQVQQRFPLHRGRSAGQGGSLLRELSDAQVLLLRWNAAGRTTFWHARQGDVQRSVAFIKRHPRDVLGLALLYQMQDRTEVSSAAERDQRNRTFADLWGRIADTNDGAYRARYEQAWSLNVGGNRPEAARLLTKLYADTLKTGALPPIDRRFKDALQSFDKKAPVDEWNPLMRATAKQFIKDKHFEAVVALASQCRSLDEPALADTLLAELLDAVKDQPDGAATKRMVVQFYASANELARADALLEEFLSIDSLPSLSARAIPTPAAGPGSGTAPPGAGFGPPGQRLDDKLTEDPTMWRLAARVADRRGMRARSIACLEKALDLEYQHLPEVIDLRTWRDDYGQLLDHYVALARSARTLNVPAAPDLKERTLRAMDRWRAHDPEAADGCKKAAEAFAPLGETDLAWDYTTTTMIGHGLDVGRWQSVAQDLNQAGEYQLADRALVVASEVEPTNGEVVWQRANNLRQAGKNGEADKLLRRLAEEQWPERYQGICSHARYALAHR